jgi:hypothetical protein
MSKDMATLFLSLRCPHSKEIMEELKRTNNESYRVVFVDHMRRHMLPPVVTAVPMVVNVNGETLKGDALFDKVFRRNESDPDPIDCGMGGSLLDERHDEAANPNSYMQRFYEPMPQLPPEDKPDDKSVSLEDLQQRRNQSIDGILGSQPRPL